MIRSKSLCLITIIAVFASVSMSVWHTHHHEFQDNCSACQFLQVSATELSVGLELDPMIVVWRTMPTIRSGIQIGSVIETKSSRAPPPRFSA
jgi:hypothetical protein